MSWFNRAVITEYRFARGLVVRALGLLLVGLGLLLLLVAVGGAALGWPRDVLTVVLVVTTAAVVVLALTGLLVRRRVGVVRLDDEGYRVRLLRGAGTMQARWRDVEDVVTADLRGTRGVVVRLRNGTSTSIPVAVLDADPAQFVEDLRGHLDRAHGYRRLR
ncbi:MAG: hypothetical protein QOK15_1309 [Nocardioidaceae bacterium]|nr:hypothetical protein [Nocardioidaceae bacterium]